MKLIQVYMRWSVAQNKPSTCHPSHMYYVYGSVRVKELKAMRIVPLFPVSHITLYQLWHSVIHSSRARVLRRKNVFRSSNKHEVTYELRHAVRNELNQLKHSPCISFWDTSFVRKSWDTDRKSSWKTLWCKGNWEVAILHFCFNTLEPKRIEILFYTFSFTVGYTRLKYLTILNSIVI